MGNRCFWLYAPFIQWRLAPGEWQTDDNRKHWQYVTGQGTAMSLQALVSVFEHPLPCVCMTMSVRVGWCRRSSSPSIFQTLVGRLKNLVTQITQCLQCKGLSLWCSRHRNTHILWPGLNSGLFPCLLSGLSLPLFWLFDNCLDFLPVRSLLHFWSLSLQL